VALRVYSEFQRVDPFGDVLAVDRAVSPREILSPAVVRNGYASFHVVVTTRPKETYFLAVQSNPADVFEWSIYEERLVRRGAAWIPDVLHELRSPYFGAMPDPDSTVPGQTTRAYLLDVWVPPETPVGTVRLEVLVKIGLWSVYPMEVRVLPAHVPDRPFTMRPPALPPPELDASAAVWGPLAAWLAGGVETASDAPTSVRAVIRRNAAQDMALARPELRAQILGMAWNGGLSSSLGAEWYLRVRDLVYRG
jgi:hypothetical protein